jgi:IclR family acetate operon transcriptional repressor
VVAEAVRASERLTGEPARDVDALLAAVRQDGYASDIQENEVGICCVGAPVFDHAGRVVAGLSVSMPASRFAADALATTGARVRAGADELSRRLGWNGTAVAEGDPGDFPLPPPAPRPKSTVPG